MKDPTKVPNRYINNDWYYYKVSTKSRNGLYQDFRVPEEFTVFTFYRINSGDSIHSIARKFYGYPEMFFVILDANPEIESAWDVQNMTGEVIKIPRTGAGEY